MRIKPRHVHIALGPSGLRWSYRIAWCAVFIIWVAMGADEDEGWLPLLPVVIVTAFWLALFLGMVAFVGARRVVRRIGFAVERARRLRRLRDTPPVPHDYPHFNAAGGCLCRRSCCVTPPPEGRQYGKCICRECTQDCPTEKIERVR